MSNISSEQIIHDLTIALISNVPEYNTPGAIVQAYFEHLTKVTEAYKNNKPPKKKGYTAKYSEVFGNRY